MKLKDEIFCKSVGAYSGQLTKRKSYIIEGINDRNVRIKNNQNRLRWYSQHYFDFEKEPEIKSINIDDEIKDNSSGMIEVTIEYSDGDRYWTNFTTPKYLSKLLTHQNYIATIKFIIVKELSRILIHQTIFELDEQDELIENCRKY